MEEQDKELDLEDNTHDINTDKLAKKYDSTVGQQQQQQQAVGQ